MVICLFLTCTLERFRYNALDLGLSSISRAEMNNFFNNLTAINKYSAADLATKLVLSEFYCYFLFVVYQLFDLCIK